MIGISPLPLHLHLFLSSPGDVTDERALAREVIERLESERAHRERLRLEIVAWDKPGAGTELCPRIWNHGRRWIGDCGNPPPATSSSSSSVRMGTPLSEKHHKPNGGPYWSGTEYEYLDALNAARQQGIPEVLVYRKQGAPEVKLDDPQFEEKRVQWQRVEATVGCASRTLRRVRTHEISLFFTIPAKIPEGRPVA